MLNKNDVVTLEITALTNEGSGVGHYGADENSRGMAVFVPFTAVGDVISCRIVKVLKSYAYGRLEAIRPLLRTALKTPARFTESAEAAASGTFPMRRSFAQGGLRARRVRRIGGLSPEMLPIRGSESVDGYRNKLQMPLSRQDGRTVCGFFSERVPGDTHGKVRAPAEIFAEIANFVTEQADRLAFRFIMRKARGVLRHVYLRRGHYSGRFVSVLSHGESRVPEARKERYGALPQITGVVLNINREKTNVILGDEEIVLAGKPDISDTMCSVKVEISPRAFYQVNTPAAEALYAQAAEFAEPEGKLLLDLYCGAGTIGLSMAGKARRLIGAEIVPQAVENARRNAERNSIGNAEFICADAGQAAKQLESAGERPDVIILDPPRKGCDDATLTACAGMQPERIVMISCNAATAARDCKRLEELGYALKKVRPFDLFPRTSHVECAAVLIKK
ncbi:MAG: 23S rRNA (uracil(1939)-C(5))-methyltransferase RlmD [Oscillospiraceae bacterium]